jgi:alkylation response protein AidB-like acyl-CoA dehydrogenase
METSHSQETNNEDLLVDTSKMSKEKREALEISEAAREKKWKHPSFVRQLFLGEFIYSMIAPFPLQSDEDRKVGDQLLEEVGLFLKTHVDADQIDANGEIPKNILNDLFKMGIFAMKVPKEYGGLGLSQVNYNRIMRLIASHCGSTAVLISAHQSIGVPQPLKSFGTEEQKRKYLPRFRENAISAFALTEVNVGSDPAQMTTEAYPTEDGKHFIINGEKLWCTNGPIADVMVVMARTPSKKVKGKEKKQITAFIVEKNMPGIEVMYKCRFMGLKAIENGFLRFTNVKVPAENILWGEGRGLALALSTLNTGRLTIPAACAGAASQCLSIAKEWGAQRKQWGHAIAYHEACSTKIAKIASHTFAIEAVTWLTSQWADQGTFDIRIEAAMAKLFCSERGWEIANLTLQLRGGRGYETAVSLKERGETPYPVERILRDARINSIIEGTSEIMRLFLAREVLDAHLQKLEPILKKQKKAQNILESLKFYSAWYPKQWFYSSTWAEFKNSGELHKEFSYISKYSHKLARTLFHLMVKYKQTLESKQIILAHIVDIGTELFAMAATASYALAVEEKQTYDDSPIQLAKHFCVEAKRRIRQHFVTIKDKDESHKKCTESILEEKMHWLENDIVKIKR